MPVISQKLKDLAKATIPDTSLTKLTNPAKSSNTEAVKEIITISLLTGNVSKGVAKKGVLEV